MASDSVLTPLDLTPPRMSRLTVIAFALSLASLFLSAGVAAVVLGVLSLRRIHRSGQAAKGRGLAKAAIVLPILPFLFAAANTAHTITPEMRCGTHLSSLGVAMLLYANEHNDQLPPPSQWCDLLVSFGGVEPDILRCPGTQRAFLQSFYPLESYLYLRHRLANRQQGPCDYAMNENAMSVSSSRDLVLCFEASPGWNQSGGPEILTTDHHGGRGCNIMFIDTHVEFIPAEKLGRLKWKQTE